MNDDRKIIIHFNYGTKMEVSFPTQIKNSTAAVQEALKRIMESDKLAIRPKESSSSFHGPACNTSRWRQLRPPCLLVPSKTPR